MEVSSLVLVEHWIGIVSLILFAAAYCHVTLVAS